MFKTSQLINKVLDGKYHIDKKLGQGGMGAVFLATHIGTKRPIALKIIAPQFMTNTNFVERFKREAEAMGRLRHPNVVNVTDFGFTNINDKEVAYMVMEYLDGSNLGDFIKEKGKLSLDLIVDIVEQVCLAIDKAHQQGIIHRDLKPDNIWLEPNGRGGYNIKVLDFGLAKLRPLIPVADKAQDSVQTVQKTNLTSNSKPAETVKTINLTNVNQNSKNFEDVEDTKYFEDIEDTKYFEDNETNHNDKSEAVTLIRKTPSESNTNIINDRVTNNSLPSNTLPSQTVSTTDLTQAGDVLGTPRYMSPEQCSGEQELDGRSDLYSLGVIIYQMLAGETPFRGSLFSLIVHHTTTPPPPLQEKVKDIPESVSKLVMSTLAKDPKDRPPNAMAFATAFRANASGESAFLRQAISLYSNHFFQFVQVAFFGYTPMIIGIVGFFMGMLIPVLHKPLIIFAIISYFLFAQIINNAVTGTLIVAMVAHFIESPSLPFDYKSVYETFKARIKAFSATSVIAHRSFLVFVALPIMTSSVLPLDPNSFLYWAITLVLLVITGLSLRRSFLNGMWLYTPVCVWENYQGKAAIDRSRTLVQRLEGSIGKIFPLFVFVIINMSILAIMLGWSFIKHISKGLFLSDIIVETVTISLGVTLSIIICTLLCPMIGIGYALFYIKARQSGGEWSKGVKL